MSIPLADTLPSTLPAALPVLQQTASGDAKMLLIVGLCWTAIALVLARALGAFRPHTISGPQRLMPEDSAWDLLGVLGLSFATGVFTSQVLVSLLHATGPRLLLVQAAADVSGFAAGVLLLAGIRTGSINALGLNLRKASFGIAGGALTIFILYPLIQLTSAAVELFRNLIQLPKPKPHEILQLLNDAPSRRLAMFAVVLAVVIAPFNEELWFRALLQTTLTRLFNWIYLQGMTTASPFALATPGAQVPAPALSAPKAGVRWAAVIVTAAVFAASHREAAFFPPLFLLALGLGYVYERTGNLWITITAHALFNTAQIMLFMAQPR